MLQLLLPTDLFFDAAAEDNPDNLIARMAVQSLDYHRAATFEQEGERAEIEPSVALPLCILARSERSGWLLLYELWRSNPTCIGPSLRGGDDLLWQFRFRNSGLMKLEETRCLRYPLEGLDNALRVYLPDDREPYYSM